jgi:hypothetical protein
LSNFQVDLFYHFPGDKAIDPLDNQDEVVDPVGSRIALGLSDYLVPFASRCHAQTWMEFAKADPLSWKLIFLELVDNPSTIIFFNLHNVNVEAGLLRAATGRGSPTDWELFQIYEHDSWWPRIEWWNEESPVSNPFDSGEAS